MFFSGHGVVHKYVTTDTVIYNSVASSDVDR